jgi:hypothetical protein
MFSVATVKSSSYQVIVSSETDTRSHVVCIKYKLSCFFLLICMLERHKKSCFRTLHVKSLYTSHATHEIIRLKSLSLMFRIHFVFNRLKETCPAIFQKMKKLHAQKIISVNEI